MAAARRDVDTALRVAVLVSQDVPRGEIARRLGIAPADVRTAIKRLEAIAPELER